jgi:hypothetical protein
MAASSELFKHAACRAHLGADEQHVGRCTLMKSAAALSHRVNVQPVADCVTTLGLQCVGRTPQRAWQPCQPLEVQRACIGMYATAEWDPSALWTNSLVAGIGLRQGRGCARDRS